MSQEAGQPAAGRTPGVAQVSSLAVPPSSGKGITGPFVATALILVALAVAGGIVVGGRVGRNITESFSVLYDAWQQQDQSLQQVEIQLQTLQQQLTEWGALEGDSSANGVVVISREQAREVAHQAGAVASTVGSLRRVISQRQAIIGRTSESLQRDARASLWAVAAGVLVAALIGGIWLVRATTRPLSALRRGLQVADQGQQALATALGPWFGRLGDALDQRLLETEEQSAALNRLAARMDVLAGAARRLDAEALSLSSAAEQFDTLAERIREFGGESKVLALSAAIEGARMEAQGRSVTVVAEELRRVASEAKETVRQLAELKTRLDAAAQAARRAASQTVEEAAAAGEQAQAIRAQASGLAERLRELQARARAAAQAALSWSSRGSPGRSSLELRVAVERALSGTGSERHGSEVSRQEKAALVSATEGGAQAAAAGSNPPAPSEAAKASQ
ncbi:MAG: hypothetical protein AB1609_11810 [Bacillota bacterium]